MNAKLCPSISYQKNAKFKLQQLLSLMKSIQTKNKWQPTIQTKMNNTFNVFITCSVYLFTSVLFF